MSEQDFPDVAPTSRMQYMAKPFVHPGKCACCGSVERPVIDFGMTIEFYGAVLLCVTCLAEAGNIVGLVPVEELRAVQESLAQSIDENLKANGKVAISNELAQLITVAVSDLSDYILPLSPSSDAVDDGSTTKAEPDLFTTISADDGKLQDDKPSESGTFEQEFDVTFSQGPFKLSSSSSNGSPNLTL